MKQRAVIVIGGGAAGLTAAISAARLSANVTIIEHTEHIGKKILATGNGRCNLTNLNQKAEYYYCEQKEYPWKVLKSFNAEQTLQFFQELGIYTKNKNGYIYPYSEQASSVLEVLQIECSRLNVKIALKTKVEEVRQKNKQFQILTNQGMFLADSLIIATGSKASPKTGSDGSGYVIAKKMGHKILEPLPTLVALKSQGNFWKTMAGVRCDARLSLYIKNCFVRSERGELQITDYGISGIPTFQISHDAVKALNRKCSVLVSIDFMPECKDEIFPQFFSQRIRSSKTKTVEELFLGLLHNKLASVLIKQSKVPFDLPCHKLSKEQITRLITVMKNFEIPIVGSNSYEQAQACLGGVDTKELTEALESKRVKNLYFAGEVVDVDGICGGYNLQWAWSSGYVAGFHAATEHR